jgi:hypothetical protein
MLCVFLSCNGKWYYCWVFQLSKYLAWESHTHTRTHTHSRTLARSHTHTHIHTHTHTHTHTQSSSDYWTDTMSECSCLMWNASDSALSSNGWHFSQTGILGSPRSQDLLRRFKKHCRTPLKYLCNTWSSCSMQYLFASATGLTVRHSQIFSFYA